MIYSLNNKQTGSECRLFVHPELFDRDFYGKDREKKLLTIAWNKGEDQKVIIDGIEYIFTSGTVLCLMVNQSFQFEDSSRIVAWQFNRDFYCIETHDEEVSCVGFLFYGSADIMFIAVDEKDHEKLSFLQSIFIEEFQEIDGIQEDMIRMLIKRLIIIITRLGKKQFLKEELPEVKLDIIRSFNLLVEKNYKTQHSVKFYADQLHKSPKTLSNLFRLYNSQSPSSVIQQRIFLEAKRLLLFTDKSVKEITYELGFEDVSYFSNFFKRLSGNTPVSFKKKKPVKK
ncbi:helix-turn-helix domain-containing protein [Chryseobacterium sp. VD8]|uniref:helix-turn-helix domain-containing protein n=1 Tax=Chryseobacterium sp. VD8 TaxID=3081254 RepID=UPI003016F5E5